jgi:hypothetical protein
MARPTPICKGAVTPCPSAPEAVAGPILRCQFADPKTGELTVDQPNMPGS